MRILIIKMSSYGDILQAYRAVSILKRQYPHLKIDWVLDQRCASLASQLHSIDQCFVFDAKNLRKSLRIFSKEIRKVRYDMAFDMQGNCKSALITFLCKAKKKIGFGWKYLPEWPNGLVTNRKIKIDPTQSIYEQYEQFFHPFFPKKEHAILPSFLTLSSEKQEQIQAFVKKVENNSLFVCIGTKWSNKKLPSRFWIHLLTQLEKKYDYTFIFPFQSPEEEQEVSTIAEHLQKTLFLKDLPFSLVQQLMRRSEGILAVDSALLHLGFLGNVPSFSFFGPSSSSAYAPKGAQHQSFQGSCPFHQKFNKRCDRLRTCEKAPCMHNIELSDVYPDVVNWIETSQRLKSQN